MLSKEQVLDIIVYCDEHGMRRKDRLRELGVSEWTFYQSRRKYLKQEDEDVVNKRGDEGRFIQLTSTGRFVTDRVSDVESTVNPDKKIRPNSTGEIKIECQTPRGGLMRMSGPITPAMVTALLQSL